MSTPSTTACSSSRTPSTLTTGRSRPTLAHLPAPAIEVPDAEQPSDEIRQLRDDPVEFLGHPEPGHGVEVDPVDRRQVDIDGERAGAHALEAKLPGRADDGCRGGSHPHIHPAP